MAICGEKIKNKNLSHYVVSNTPRLEWYTNSQL